MSEISSFLSADAQKQISNYIKELEKIAGQYKVIAEGASNLQTEEQQKLKTEQELLKVGQEQEKLTKLKVQNLKNEQAATDKLNKALAKEQSEYQKLNTQYKTSIANTRELATRYGATSTQARKAAAETEVLRKKLKAVNDTTGAPASNNVGKYFQAIMKGAGALGLAVGAAQLFTKSFEALKNGSQTFGDAWAVMMGGLTASTSTFFAMLGTGNFENFFQRLKDSAKAGRELAAALDDLTEANLSLGLAEAKSNKTILLLEEGMNDVRKSTVERKDLAREVLNEESKIAGERVAVAIKTFDAYADAIEGMKGVDKDKLISFIENFNKEEDLRKKVNEIQQKLASRISGEEKRALIDGMTEQERIYREFLIKYGATTDEEVKNVIESYGNIIKAENTEYENRKRAKKKYNAFVAELDKTAVKDTKKTVDEQLDSEDDFFNGLSALHKRNYDESRAVIEAKRKDESEFQVFLSGIVDAKTKEEIAATEEDQKRKDKTKEKDLQRIEDIKQAAQMALEATAMIGNEIFARNNMQRDAELQGVEGMYRDKMILAGDDKELQLAAEREARRERGKIAQEQAKADKQNALFNIAINTAMGVSMAWGQTGIFGIVAQIPVIAMGILQAALVASRPMPAIPAYFKGTENSSDTFIAGEKGAELGITKKGDVFLTPDKATLYSGMAGTKIIPNSETMQILNATEKTKDNLKPELRAIRKAVENSRTTVNIVNKYDARYEKRYQNMKA